MGKTPENINPHYSYQAGHFLRGVWNNAIRQVPGGISRGELMVDLSTREVMKRKMRRVQNSGKGSKKKQW